jgi:hypothetical protein
LNGKGDDSTKTTMFYRTMAWKMMVMMLMMIAAVARVVVVFSATKLLDGKSDH